MLLLRVALIEYHAKYTAIGSIPSYAYENFCEMYEAYRAMGGNGMVVKMKLEIDDLNLKRKEEVAIGSIPSYAYENFCEMYEAYRAMGGNGMVVKMKLEIDDLNLKRKEEVEK